MFRLSSVLAACGNGELSEAEVIGTVRLARRVWRRGECDRISRSIVERCWGPAGR